MGLLTDLTSRNFGTQNCFDRPPQIPLAALPVSEFFVCTTLVACKAMLLWR
jgi:hypothetical protein